MTERDVITDDISKMLLSVALSNPDVSERLPKISLRRYSNHPESTINRMMTAMMQSAQRPKDRYLFLVM